MRRAPSVSQAVARTATCVDAGIGFSYRGNAYRIVYTSKLRDSIYVLHAFQKKAKRGSATSKTDVELIQRRLRLAMKHHRGEEEQAGHGQT